MKILTVAVLLCFAMMSFAQADVVVDISSNGASYFWDPANQNGDFDNASAGAADVLFEDSYFVRVFGNQAPFPGTRIVELTDAVTGVAQYQGTTNSGDTAVSVWNILDGTFIPVNIYTVTLTQTISNPSFGVATLDYQWDITNVAGDAGSDIDLFHFGDYDINPFGANSSTAGFDGSDVVIDTTGTDGNVRWTGFDALAFELREVGVGNRITTDILASTTYELDNDPTSLSSVDVTGAMQWDAISPGVGNTVTMFGRSVIIPEPGATLVLGLVSLMGLIRRRRD